MASRGEQTDVLSLPNNKEDPVNLEGTLKEIKYNKLLYADIQLINFIQENHI